MRREGKIYMLNYFRGIKLGIAITSGLLVLSILLFLGLRVYSMHSNQDGCWTFKTELFSVDAGSVPSCYQEGPPIK